MSNEVEVLASRFHGALAAGHAFALWFNWRRRNRFDSAVHAAFLLYDLYSAYKHHKEANAQNQYR